MWWLSLTIWEQSKAQTFFWYDEWQALKISLHRRVKYCVFEIIGTRHKARNNDKLRVGRRIVLGDRIT